jgi:hypothetical protein
MQCYYVGYQQKKTHTYTSWLSSKKTSTASPPSQNITLLAMKGFLAGVGWSLFKVSKGSKFKNTTPTWNRMEDNWRLLLIFHNCKEPPPTLASRRWVGSTSRSSTGPSCPLSQAQAMYGDYEVGFSGVFSSRVYSSITSGAVLAYTCRDPSPQPNVKASPFPCSAGIQRQTIIGPLNGTWISWRSLAVCRSHITTSPSSSRKVNWALQTLTLQQELWTYHHSVKCFHRCWHL